MGECAQERCFCCGEQGKQGISLAGRFLCADCERRLVRTKPGSARYERFVERCKEFWAALKS